MTTQGTVLLIGGTGFLGKLVGMHLTEHGYTVTTVALEDPSDFISLGYPCTYHQWDGVSLLPDEALVQDGQTIDIVINLAGDPLSSDRWLARKRKAIVESRIRAVEVAVDAANRCQAKTLIQASSLDYYGDAGGEEVTEDSPVGRGFWPEAIARWERAASTLNAVTRLVVLRIGEVYSLFGGTFRERHIWYCMRVGAPIVDRRRFLGWIHSRDFTRLVQQTIEDASFEGPINATAPEPCSYAELHREFCRYYPGFLRLPVPYWVKRLVFGREMVKTRFNRRPLPIKALKREFEFEYPTIASCMAELLDRNVPRSFYHTRNLWLPTTVEEYWEFMEKAENWPGLNPASFRMVLQDCSKNKRIGEGVDFSFDLYFFGFIKSTWAMKHVNLKKPHFAQSITQEGSMEMLEMTSWYTEVAGGMRVDEMMRYQFPGGALMNPISYLFAIPVNKTIFDHRLRFLQKTFGTTTRKTQAKAG